MRGWQSPELLRLLGARYHIDPEFFRQHLDFVKNREFFDLPALPSTSLAFWRLRVTTICDMQLNNAGSVRDARRSHFSVIGEHQRNLWAKGPVGSSIIRRYTVHDETTYTIERDISISVRKQKRGGWVALVWLDSGNPLDESSWAPWRDNNSSSNNTSVSPYLPTIQHRPRIALDHDELPATHTSVPGPEPLQSSFLLPSQYGSSLDRDVMRTDALYALSDVFAFSASAENQFVNLMQQQVDGAIREFHQQEEWSVAPLRYSKDLLNDHIQYFESTIRSLESEDKMDLPRAEDSAGLETRKVTLELLLEDFRYLLLRSQSIATRAKEGMDMIMNDVLLQESQKAIAQAREISRITILAYFFLPMSFVTSLFGMNFVEFEDWRLAIGSVLGVFLLVTAAAVLRAMGVDALGNPQR